MSQENVEIVRRIYWERADALAAVGLSDDLG